MEDIRPKIPTQEAKNGDSEAEELLPIGERLGSEKTGGRAFNSILQEASRFEIGVGINYVVKAPILNPFQPHFHYAPPLLMLKLGM